MAKPKNEQYEIDPGDGLIRGLVGTWSIDKHQRLLRYVHASHGARRKFSKEYGKETSFIDLYCGPGKARIRHSNPERLIDGSAVTAAITAASCTPYTSYLIGDLNSDFVSACEARLRATGIDKIETFVGPAENTVTKAVSRLQRSGLHFAFIDPFNADLPFTIIASLAELNRMDQLIHFSVMDVSRNLNAMKEDGRLDDLAPGWSGHIKKTMGIDAQRMAIFRHWQRLLEEKLGYAVSEKVVKVRGPRGAEIYWLVFASRHDLGGRLWKEVADISPQPQRDLFKLARL
jgi:three-Cys-motif partner protein